MYRRIRSTMAVAALVVSPAFASTWEIDSAHTSAQFAIRHLMLSTVRGHFGKTTGTVVVDESDLTRSKVEAVIDVATIDTREPKRDEHLRSPEFFDARKFPAITFKSKAIAKAGEGSYRVTGDLSIRGIAKEVVLDVEGSPAEIKDPFGNVKLGGVAHARINRKDFGITWNKVLDTGGLALGETVDITIDIELTKKTGP